jgi:hypothetical protein
MLGASLGGYVCTCMFIWRDLVGESNREVEERVTADLIVLCSAGLNLIQGAHYRKKWDAVDAVDAIRAAACDILAPLAV